MNEISAEVDLEIEWWRPLVQWVLCIPHLLVNGVLALASIALWLVSIPVVLVLGRLPASFAAFHLLVLRERARTFAYLFVLRRDHPPFGWDDDARSVLVVRAPAGRPVPRLGPVTRPVEVLPHALLLVPVGACLDALYPLWMVLVAIGRGWPVGMARTLLGIERWVVAIILYATCVSDEKPAFGLAEHTAAATA